MPRHLDKVEVTAKVAELEVRQPALVVSRQFARTPQLEICLGYLEPVVGTLQHLEALAAIAKEWGVPLVVDNTLATPYLCLLYTSDAADE